MESLAPESPERTFYPSTPEETFEPCCFYPVVCVYNPVLGPVLTYQPFVLAPLEKPSDAPHAKPETTGTYSLKINISTLLNSRRIRDFLAEQTVQLKSGQFVFKVMLQPANPWKGGKTRFRSSTHWRLILKAADAPEGTEGPPQALLVYVNGVERGTWRAGTFLFSCDLCAAEMRQEESLDLVLS